MAVSQQVGLVVFLRIQYHIPANQIAAAPMEIGLISDTHGFLDPNIPEVFASVDEIWHAGDFGSLEVAHQLQQHKPLRGVYGNIDSAEVREAFAEDLWFEMAGLSVLMTHIAGRPGRYDKRIKSLFAQAVPDVLVCGHSHMLRIEKDKSWNAMQYLNPGAAGHRGMHLIRTVLKFELSDGDINNIRVIELGPRGRSR